jgi:hypothetical protein
MYSKIAFIFVSLLIAAPSAFATGSASSAERLCRREFAHDLIKCVVTSFFQRPKVRGEKLKACVTTAKDERNSCLNPNPGPSQCELSCQATYDTDVATCNATYDPAVCLDYGPCVDFYTQERATCISQAVDTLNSCNQSCPAD